MCMMNDTKVSTHQDTCTYLLGMSKKNMVIGSSTLLLTLSICCATFSILFTSLITFALKNAAQLRRSPFMQLLFYACLNNICFASMGQLQYGLTVGRIVLGCNKFVVIDYLTKATHSFALSMMLLISYGRYLHTKHLTQIQSHVTLKRVNRATLLALLYSCCHVSIPYIALNGHGTHLKVAANIVYVTMSVTVLATTCLFYFKGLCCMKKRQLESAAQQNIAIGAKKFLVMIILTLGIVLPLHLPFTLLDLIEAILIPRESQVSLWFRYYYTVVCTIHLLFPTANGTMCMYNNKDLRVFLIKRIRIVRTQRSSTVGNENITSTTEQKHIPKSAHNNCSVKSVIQAQYSSESCSSFSHQFILKERVAQRVSVLATISTNRDSTPLSIGVESVV